MSDLISRQAAINTLERKKDKNAKGDIGWFHNKIIQNDIDALMQLPATQLEIVRCKDCKHRPVMLWNEANGDFDVLAPEVDGKEDWRCPCLIEDDPYYSWSPNDNWFCGNGERRESDGNGK